MYTILYTGISYYTVDIIIPITTLYFNSYELSMGFIIIIKIISYSYVPTQGLFSVTWLIFQNQVSLSSVDWLVACVWWCCLIGGDAGEEVRGPVCVPAGSENDPDGVPAVPHEQELREASQLRLREQDDPPHHPVQHEDAGTLTQIHTHCLYRT